MINFIPNNCFDFTQLNNNINKVLVNDLITPLINKGFFDKNLNLNKFNFLDYRTLNFDDYLLLFLGLKKNLKKEDIYFCYKINFIDGNIIDVWKINLLDENEINENMEIKDINISINKDIIYLFYILYDTKKFYIKCKRYNKYLITLLKNDTIELKKDFIPKILLNDNKYLYCINTNKILLIKKNNEFTVQKYFNCSFHLFENNLMNYKEIKDLSMYKMYNSLSINNLLILNNLATNKKFIAKLIILLYN